MEVLDVRVRMENDEDISFGLDCTGKFTDKWQPGAYDRTHGEGPGHNEYQYIIPEAVEALKGELEYSAKYRGGRAGRQETFERMNRQRMNQVRFMEALGNGSGFWGITVKLYLRGAEVNDESVWGREYGYPGSDDDQNARDFFSDVCSLYDVAKELFPLGLHEKHFDAYTRLLNHLVMRTVKQELSFELEQTQKFEVELPTTPAEIAKAACAAALEIRADLWAEVRSVNLESYRWSPRKFKLETYRKLIRLYVFAESYVEAIKRIPVEALSAEVNG
jgi:hypothetical protein